MRNFKIFLVLLAILLIVIFVLQNSYEVNVSFWLWEYTLPLSLLIVINTILGFLIGFILKFTKPKPKETDATINSIEAQPDSNSTDELP